MSNTDRYVRIVLALILTVVGYVYGLWWLYIVAIIPLLMSFVGFCPLYCVFNFSTKKNK